MFWEFLGSYINIYRPIRLSIDMQVHSFLLVSQTFVKMGGTKLEKQVDYFMPYLLIDSRHVLALL
jgi:hypothetical protein